MINITIIDHSFPSLSDSLPVHLKQQVVNVDGFSDANAALTYLWAKRYDPEKLPDIIFLNLEMPGLSGWDFLFAAEMFFPLISKSMGIIATGNPGTSRDLHRVYLHKYVVDVLARHDYETYLYTLVA